MSIDRKINSRRRDFIKIAAALGGGYMIGQNFPASSNADSSDLNAITNKAFEKSSSTTYYQSNQQYHVHFPELNQDGNYDVCIIGGGLTGLSSALHLIDQKHKVILLEADTIASKASGVNGGQVLNSYECEMEFFEKKFGDEIAEKFWDLSLDAVEIVKSNIKKYNINCGWRAGSGVVAYKEKHIAILEDDYETKKSKYGYENIKLYSAKETRELIGSDKYYGLLYDSNNGHMNPLNYALALAHVIKKSHNVDVFENSKVTTTEFNTTHGHTVIVNGKHKITAKKIILAANYANGDFLPELKADILLLDTFILVTEPIRNDLAQTVIKNNMALFDTRNVMDYYRFTETNNLLFGGGDAFGKFNIQDIKHSLYREVLHIFPQLAGIKINHFWEGKESITLNLAPLIGKAFDGSVRYAHGYSGQGLALSNLVGKMMADAINGNTENIDLFEKIKPFSMINSKPLKELTVKAGAYYYKLIDKIL